MLEQVQEYDWEAGYWASVWPSCEWDRIEERARQMRWDCCETH